MTGEQDYELIDKATTFENALGFALDVVKPMMFEYKGNSLFEYKGNSLLMLVMEEVRNIDEDFITREKKICTFESFYTAVLLMHSNLILFSDFTNKGNTFTKKASTIHLKIIKEIINLECEFGTSGHCDVKEKDKYLNIWKKLLKNIVHLCYEYSSNRDASQNNVNNKNFLFKPIHFPKISLSWLKKILSTKIDFKFQTASVAENDNPNQSQSPPPANQSGVSLEMIHMAIIMSVVFIGLILALTVIR